MSEAERFNVLKVLDLFSGIGGFSLGLERTGGFETVAFCEIDPFCQKVLKKHWPETYIHDDIRSLNKETLCRGFTQNAALVKLCKAAGAHFPTVESAITIIKKHCATEIEVLTENIITIGLKRDAKKSFPFMAESALVVESENMHSLLLTTRAITETANARNTKPPLGSSLSNADILTIIRFFVITATWQKPLLANALIEAACGSKEWNDDVRTLTAERLAADGIAVDVITGGFPCQLFSNAARGRNNAPDLWPEMQRIIGEIRPKAIIAENVKRQPVHRVVEFGRTELGMPGFTRCISADDIGADHQRNRWWAIAHANANSKLQSAIDAEVAFMRSIRSSVWGAEAYRASIIVSDGLSGGLDETGCPGNAVVPQIPELIGRAILDSMAERFAA